MWWNKRNTSHTTLVGQAGKAIPPQSLIRALEPRIMFDGAALATAIDAAHSAVADNHGVEAAKPVDAPHEAPTPVTVAAPVVEIPSRAVVFVDSRVVDSDKLLADIAPGTEVVHLDNQSDGLTQMTNYLNEHPGATNIQIIAEGNAGDLWLGSTYLSQENIASHADQLASLGKDIQSGGDILIFACNTAKGDAGLTFVSSLANFTGRDVAASNDRTGITGDWALEITTGSIEAQSVLSAASEASYGYDLATFTVTNLNDSGTGSLRDAVTSATGNDAADTIQFDPALFASGAATITLTSGALDVGGVGNNDAFTIIGPSETLLTISGNNTSRVFSAIGDVNTSATSISGMTLINANSTGGPGYGGGAILSYTSGSLILDHVVIKNSTSSFYGGGVRFYGASGAGNLTVTNSTIDGNTSNGIGVNGGSGGISGFADNITITNSTISNNSGVGGFYGGGAALSGRTSLTITNATFSGNTVGLASTNSGGGGGLIVTSAATITNTTIVGNSFVGGDSVNNGGGGLSVFNIGSNTVTLKNSIIANNTSTNSNFSDENVIVTHTSTLAGSNNIITTPVGLHYSAVNNLTSTTSTLGSALGSLQYNGGAVKTIALAASSNAIGAGTTTGAPITDARGFVRGASIDIGAFEYSDNGTFDFSGVVSPSNGSIVVPSDYNLSIEFGETVSAVAAKNIVIYRQSDNAVLETISATDSSKVTLSTGIGGANSKVTINPTATFLSNTAYYVLIDSGAFQDGSSKTFNGISSAATWAFTAATVANATPAIANLNADSVAWAGVGNSVVLDASGNASLTDSELGALNSGNGNWSGASLSVQRSATAISSDTFGFNTSGALFTVSGSNLQSGGLTFATFTNTGGVLTITATSSGTTATTALMNDVAQRITYRNDTPSGDATVRFTLSDGTSSTTANVTVTSDTIYVTNSTDTATIELTSGVSFSEAIAIAAADVTGSQTIVFASSLASTSLTVSGVTLNESLTFDMDSASGMSLTTGAINIASGTLTLSNGTGDTATISSALSGSGAITKAGAGTITFSGTNTYAGATTLSAGTLAVSGGDAISSNSSVTVASGASLSLSGNEIIGNLSGAGAISLGSNTLTTLLTADTTFSGNIGGTGGFNINQTGAATFALTLSGTNTYTGGTTLQNYGWLKLNGDAAFSDSSALRVNGNSKLTLLSDQTVGSVSSSASTASLALGSFTLTAGGDNTDTTVAGVISGTGNLVKQGTGTITLSGTNTYSGTTTVSGGTLSVASDGNIGSGTVTLASGTTLEVTGATTIDNAITLAGDATINNSADATVSGNIAGSANLTKAGGSTLTLAGTNVYTGGTTVSSGTLSVAGDSNLGAGTITLNNSALAVTGATTIDNAITLANDGTINNSAATTLSGQLSGSYRLSKTGAGDLTLANSSNSSMTGEIAIFSANLLVANGSYMPSTVVLLGGNLTFTAATTVTGVIAVQANSTITNNNSVTISNFLELGSANQLTKAGSGTLTLSSVGNSQFMEGGITIQAGTLSVSDDRNLSQGDVTINGGTLALTATGTYDNNFILGASNATINVSNSATATLSGNITGTGSLSKTGTAKLLLSGIDSFTGATNVNAGSLLVNGSLSGTSAVTVASGAILGGSGSIFANSSTNTLTVQSGGTLSPGNSPGTITVNGNLTMASGSTLAIEINGATAGTGYDQVIVNGTVDVSGATLSTTHGYTPGSGDTYTIITNDASDAITGTFSGLAEGATAAAGGNSTVLTASYIGGTGNDFTLTAPTNPVVTGVSSSTANGTYKIGDTISVNVSFDVAVTVNTTGGIPTLRLETGTTDRTLSYVSGSGTSTLTFIYTVQAGDTSADLDYTSTSALALNGGTIQDATNNNANLTLASPGAANSLGANKAIAIDGIAPTANIVVADSALKIGETSLVTITFSEAVTGFDNTDLTIENGTLSTISSGDGGITWTATFTPTASVTDTTNLITLANTGVQDAAGNAGTGTTDSNNYAIDTLAPVAPTIVSLTSGTDTGVSSSDGITNNTTPTITGTAEANSTVTIYVDTVSVGTTTADGSGNWSYAFGTALSEGTRSIKAAATDAAGNMGAQSSALSVTIDTASPSGTVVVSDTALAAGETSLVTITFNEAVTGFTTADMSVANGTITGLSSANGGVTWTATFTPSTNVTDTTNLITLANNGVADAAGNAGTGSTNSNNYAIDTQRPTATIVVADTALAAGETSLVTITFSEAVSGFTNADLNIQNGTLTPVGSSDGGITWTATYTPNANISIFGPSVIALNNTVIQDLSGNAGTGTTTSNLFGIDTQRPTATIVVADTALAAGETSLVTVSFSEAVTGFNNADLTIANGILTAVSSSDGGITWTATFTPSTNVTDTTNLITLANNGVADAAGNAGTGSTNSNNYAIDTQRPTATIVVADTALAAGETSLVTLTFSEAVANFDNNDLTVANGTLNNMTTSDGGITWTGILTPTTNITDTTNVITFDSTGVIDGAGNTGLGSINSNNYTIDTAHPTATIVMADSALAIGETSLVTVTFSEAVSGFSNTDLTIANGTLSTVSSADGGITWTATFTPSTNTSDTTNLITLANTGVIDAAGNTGLNSTDSNNYAIDTLRPTATIVVADTALAAGEASGVTITFSEAVTGFSNADLTIANGTLTVVSSVDGGITWTATLTPTANITDTTNLITLANTGVADTAGNAGTGATNSNNYTIDTLRPTATIVVADTALAAGETSLVTITFSEAVSNFNNGDLSVTNGNLSAVSSGDGGTTWTATFTPTANVTDTTNLITLANTGVTDAAGNTGTGSTDSNNYAIDTLRPTATIVVADTALAAGETSLVTMTFNEAVTGLNNADLTIVNGTLSPISSTDGGITWTATFTPTANITDSTNVISLANSGVADAAGNVGSGTTDSNNYAIDTVRPTATIMVADTSLIAGETSAVTITFSEAVTSFSNADLTIANGTLSPVSSSDGGVTWTATFTPTNSLSTTANLISLANTGILDLAGNTGTGTTDSNNYAIDTLIPTVSSVGVPIGVTYNTGDVLTFTVNTSETVLVNTAGGTPRIALDIGGTTAYATYVAGSNTNTLTFQYTVKAGDNDANGISVVGLSANSGTLRDAAGNNLNIALNSVGSTAALNIDTVAPTFTSQVQGSPNAYEQSVNFIVNFSEAVDHVDVTDFSLVTTENAKATLSGFQQINDRSWLIAVTDISGNGIVRVDVKTTNDITDSAGNALSGSLTGSGGFAAQPLPAQPIPPTPAPLAPSPIDASTPTQAVAPLIVLSPDATSIGGSTNTTPLTTVEAPALATIVNTSLTVAGTSNSPPSLDTSTPGTDPIGVATATNSGTPNPQSGLVHLGSSGNQAPTGPASGPTIDRINTAQDSSLQGLPVVAIQNVQTGVPLYIPLPNTQSADVNQQLSVDVRLQNGRPLMGWLKFDPVTGTLTGQAPKGFEGKVQIQVTVRDSKGNSSSSIMELNFNGDRGQSGERDNKPAPTKTKPGANLMGKPGLNEQFALYGKGAHQLEADALLSALNQLSLAPAKVHKA